MPEEGVSDHRHERMTVKALPGPSLEVVKTEFFFHLLVSLLADPTRLDGGCQGAQVGLRRQGGEIIFLLSRHPVFGDKPSLELSFRAIAPTDGAPFGVGQHVFSGIDRMSGTCR